MLRVSLSLVRVQLLAQQHIPVLAQLALFLLLLDDVTIDMDAIFSLARVTGLLVRTHGQAADAMSYG